MYSATKQSKTPLHGLVAPATIFMVSSVLVSGGNYLFNLTMGRTVGPEAFAEVGLIVTALLVLSFLAMTFQIVAMKFSVSYEGQSKEIFTNQMTWIAIIIGSFIMISMMACSSILQHFFHLESAISIWVLALTVPVYFVLSVHRGIAQGGEEFIKLSWSYQAEMLARFVFTFLLLLLFHVTGGVAVSIGIFASIMISYISLRPQYKLDSLQINWIELRHIIQFMGLTASYECAQILINYTDILMVKHYFDEYTAGLYTSMALIGRMIYFATWMIVMILIPKVLNLRKQGLPYKTEMVKYFLIILSFSTVLIGVSYIFPDLMITLLFGEEYLPVAYLLWQYALATMLFALANLLVYYFLSIDQRKPVYLAIVAGVLQVIGLTIFHEKLSDLIVTQIVIMGGLLAIMIVYFFTSKTNQ